MESTSFISSNCLSATKWSQANIYISKQDSLLISTCHFYFINSAKSKSVMYEEMSRQTDVFSYSHKHQI
jgi:hypothetical protein